MYTPLYNVLLPSVELDLHSLRNSPINPSGPIGLRPGLSAYGLRLGRQVPNCTSISTVHTFYTFLRATTCAYSTFLPDEAEMRRSDVDARGRAIYRAWNRPGRAKTAVDYRAISFSAARESPANKLVATINGRAKRSASSRGENRATLRTQRQTGRQMRTANPSEWAECKTERGYTQARARGY